MKRPKPIQGFKKLVSRRRPAIDEVVREPTAGGVVFRRSPKDGSVQILLIQDSRDRWAIPKGHIEEGETAKQTAEREIREETGMHDIKIHGWLGKVNFRFRRQNSLVLMTTEIFLVEAKGKTENLKPEHWMNGINWFSVSDALEKIEYEDLGKYILLGVKKVRDIK